MSHRYDRKAAAPLLGAYQIWICAWYVYEHRIISTSNNRTENILSLRYKYLQRLLLLIANNQASLEPNRADLQRRQNETNAYNNILRKKKVLMIYKKKKKTSKIFSFQRKQTFSSLTKGKVQQPNQNKERKKKKARWCADLIKQIRKITT